MNLETASANVGTMDESIEASAIPDQQKQEAVESEALLEVSSGAPEDKDVDASDHNEVTKYQDSEESAHTEVPEDLDADASFLPEVTEDHEVPVAGSRYELNTQNTLNCFKKIDLNVSNIDRNDKNTWRTIYEEIDAPYFVGVKLFPK